MSILTRRKRPRKRANATMRIVLDETPEQQADRARRGDPFPAQPEWTDETLAALNDEPVPHGGDYVMAREPAFTPREDAARAAAEADLHHLTRGLWSLYRAGQFGKARDLARRWGTPRREQRPAPGSHPYPPPTQPLRPPGDEWVPMSRPYAPAASYPEPPIHPLPPPLPTALAPIRERRAALVPQWMDRLKTRYPAYDGYGHEEQYAALMRRVSLVTGTHSSYEDPRSWPSPVTDAGAPPAARRGLAITAAKRSPRHAGTSAPARRPAIALTELDLDMLERIKAGLQNLGEGRLAS